MSASASVRERPRQRVHGCECVGAGADGCEYWWVRGLVSV